MRFLLVDDPPVTLQVVHDVLSGFGDIYSVRYVEAVPVLMEAVFDLVIINAQKVDNISLFVARIFFQKLCARVVVVAGEASWQLVRDVFRAGAADFLHPDVLPGYLESFIGEVPHGPQSLLGKGGA